MYKCENCGAIFSEQRMIQESRGEYWGVPCYETMYYCPKCGNEDFDEYEDEDEDDEDE
jgi:DNA-directed RNA polymerase subunit RPC12/RpoP